MCRRSNRSRRPPFAALAQARSVQNLNQVDIGGPERGSCLETGFSSPAYPPTQPPLAMTTAQPPLSTTTHARMGQIAPFPTSGRTPVVWMGANYTCPFRPPADNRSSAFHPTESGAGWLQPCQRPAVPVGSADCPDLGGCARGDKVQQIRGRPCARSLLRTESSAPSKTP